MAFVGSRSRQSASVGPRGNSIHLPLAAIVGGNSRRRNVVPQAGTELAYYCLRNVYVTSHTYTLHQQSRCTCIGADRRSESASRLASCGAATVICVNSFMILATTFSRGFVFLLGLCVK